MQIVCPWSSGKKICQRVTSFALVRLTGLHVPGLFKGAGTWGELTQPRAQPEGADALPCVHVPGACVCGGVCACTWVRSGRLRVLLVGRPVCGEGPLTESPCWPGGPVCVLQAGSSDSSLVRVWRTWLRLLPGAAVTARAAAWTLHTPTWPRAPGAPNGGGPCGASLAAGRRSWGAEQPSV